MAYSTYRAYWASFAQADLLSFKFHGYAPFYEGPDWGSVIMEINQRLSSVSIEQGTEAHKIQE